MINISLDRCNGGRYLFTSRGHANYGSAGCDIVCAAVSALTYSLYLAIRELDISGEISNFYSALGKGECILDLTVKERALSHADGLISSYIEGLSAVADAYPENVTVD